MIPIRPPLRATARICSSDRLRSHGEWWRVPMWEQSTGAWVMRMTSQKPRSEIWDRYDHSQIVHPPHHAATECRKAVPKPQPARGRGRRGDVVVQVVRQRDVAHAHRMEHVDGVESLFDAMSPYDDVYHGGPA